ncbi:OmpA family protein [Chryseolinea lacunae]|uniref:OmpA family protein n=1 Tax=Chryseolinea lacunae TaxID=2801331 RepID=A0ABS1KTN5_9BACT|nr:OmpA family protein [Chryseolinea lacunae]MBL0742810.1 OmpA family protein [Chryseolinea lacunae]
MKQILFSRIRRVVFLLCLTVSTLQAQNLVTNPGFEEFSACPGGYAQHQTEFKAIGWYSATAGTPDHFHGCSRGEGGVPYNWAGVSQAYEGNGYAGIYAWMDNGKNYREYLQCTLITPLVKDSTYHIEFHYKLASYSAYAIDRMGLHLTDTLRKITNDRVLRTRPVLSVIQDSALTKRTGYWESGALDYRARGGEQYLLIGNFFLDDETRFYKIQFQSVQQEMLANAAYYYIDDVSVTSKYAGANLLLANVTPTFTTERVRWNTNYVLRNIRFEFDSHKLLASSFEQLDMLVGWLEEHPEARIQLAGHTDDVGGDRYNNALSLARAKTVAAYCTSQGIASTRIETFAYGKRKPLVDATTEAARSVNRRVEVTFVKE